MQIRLISFGFVLLVSWSCKPEADALRLLDELVVSTNYDTGADFGTYATYSIATDTIGFVSNAHPNDTIIVQSSQNTYPRVVLESVESNMDNLGYTRVEKDQNPDLRINVYVINDFNLFQQIVYPSYYYPSYYGYGYGYGSYYAYPYVNTYATNTGSLVVEILDLKNITPNNTVKVIWSAYMGDVYSTIDLIKQSKDAIDQAFVQSPYLGI
ncbi:MAG: DUF4136 domain-containing protein [Cyclobacteriaceae bacterium]|nr:DUF4136 domain-containing protein [Cyclobacteriaceae bacterium]MDH4295515.1 DUF4136 domain-containing protein [Cyclobacteriaceae bacterium]MDH5250966.1 DUF4136 domain-containing protein [Cyclobacteriaceae bacterium]